MATSDEYKSRYGDINYNFLLELATEAMKRANMHNDYGHPEDLVAGLTPALEAVAIGFGAGVRWVYDNPDEKWILKQAAQIRAEGP